jgi:hypothetical protein
LMLRSMLWLSMRLRLSPGSILRVSMRMSQCLKLSPISHCSRKLKAPAHP